MSNNPLVNHPPRVSDLHGDARTAVLASRAEASRRRHVASVLAERRPWWRRLVGRTSA